MDDLIPTLVYNFDNDQNKNSGQTDQTGLDEKVITDDSSKFFKSIINNTQTIKSDSPDKPKDTQESSEKNK